MDPDKKILFITGGTRPDIVTALTSLTGLEAVDGFRTSIDDVDVALVVIDCGGTLRCGLYPKKGIPTLNIHATGKSGPLSQYITPEIYVSQVTPHSLELISDGEVGLNAKLKTHVGVACDSEFDVEKKTD